MLHALTFASLFALAPPADNGMPAKDTWLQRQPWPVTLSAGIRALGFAPVPASPQGAVGTELQLVRRRIFSLELGLELGAYAQRQFARGITLDTALMPRWTAPFGLYGDLGLIVGGQASRVPGVVYRAEAGERLEASKAPITLAARLGLGVHLGYDFGRTTQAPVRLFLRYRQFAQAPFMPGNDLPAMGVAEFGAGIAVSLGGWRHTR